MTVMDDVKVLGEIAAFAGNLVAEPPMLVTDELAEHCEFLRVKLTEVVAATAYRQTVDNFAPILLQLIRLWIKARRHGDNYKASRLARAFGGLVEEVRGDASDLLALAKAS